MLFQRGCSSCHGLHGEGTNLAPTLIGVGAAAADFQLTTGRMPLPAPGARVRKPGPDLPAGPDRGPVRLRRQPCPRARRCPSSGTSNGTTPTWRKAGSCSAPTARPATRPPVRAAPSPTASTRPTSARPRRRRSSRRSAPGRRTCPSSLRQQISDDQAVAIAKYVKFVTSPPDPGGAGLGHLGPIPEGLVIWLIGMTGVAAAALWIGSRQA